MGTSLGFRLNPGIISCTFLELPLKIYFGQMWFYVDLIGTGGNDFDSVQVFLGPPWK